MSNSCQCNHDPETEEWRDIDYPEIKPIYEVSSHGRIRHKPSGRLKKPTMGHSYPITSLTRSDKKDSEKKFFVHRLVAAAFCSKPDIPSEKPLVVNHLDGKKDHSCAVNLEWCTYAENSRHAVATGLNSGKKRPPLYCDPTPEWQPLPKWNRYLVHPSGQVAVKYPRNRLRVLRPNEKGGYLTIQLHAGSISKTRPIHRLVAKVFLTKPEDPERCVVHHKDENKLNNHVSNLAWVTQRENTVLSCGVAVVQYNQDGEIINRFDSIHAAAESVKVTDASMYGVCNYLNNTRRIAGFGWKFAEKDGSAVITQEDIDRVRIVSSQHRVIYKYDLNGNKLAEYNTGVEAASSENVLPSHIVLACKGECRTAGGFVWRYKDDVDADPTCVMIREHRKRRAVVQLHRSGTECARFESAAEAKRSTGIADQNILKVCSGKRKTAGGYVWKYV